MSPSRLARYATCPRQYEYDYVWDVETPEVYRRYLDRGQVYHKAVEDTCEAVTDDPDMTDDEIRAFATERTVERWDSETDRAEYASDAQYTYDEELVLSAVDSYFATDGVAHARDSIGTELWVDCERDGIELVGRADNVVRTDDGLRVIDYKGSFSGIVTWQSIADVPSHRTGETYAPHRLKSVFQAATYIEGAKNLSASEPDMDVEFTFYALLDEKTRTHHVDGLQVEASGRGRDVGEIYRTYEDEIWALIKDCYEGIQAEAHEPTRFEEIRDESCEDCDYRAMCGDYLGSEVRMR